MKTTRRHHDAAIPADWQLTCRGSETVLVVEDDRWLREFVTRGLRDLGYRALSATDGVTALRMLQRLDAPPGASVVDRCADAAHGRR